MGGRPELRRRGSLGWLSALLGASVLTSGILLTRAQEDSITMPITVEPDSLHLGGEAKLTPEGSSKFPFCHWYRGPISDGRWIFCFYPLPEPRQEDGPSYTLREIGGPKCSLTIRNLTLEDSGLYTFRKEAETGVENVYPETGNVNIKVTVPVDSGAHSRMAFMIAGGIGGGVALLLIVLCCIYCR